MKPYRYTILASVIGMTLTIIGISLILVDRSNDILSRLELLEQVGVPIDAELTAISEWETPHDGTAYDIHYRFRVDGLNNNIRWTTYHPDLYTAYRPGGPIPILYHPDNPRSSAPAVEPVISTKQPTDPVYITLVLIGGVLVVGAVGFGLISKRKVM